MKAAEEQIKLDDPNNKTLQSLQSPPTSGGNVDILLGIAYSAIFPERIHMLESGLAIYELKMSPHVKGFNAVIGGPSFFSRVDSAFGRQIFKIYYRDCSRLTL